VTSPAGHELAGLASLIGRRVVRALREIHAVVCVAADFLVDSGRKSVRSAFISSVTTLKFSAAPLCTWGGTDTMPNGEGG
jgi:hypothetical protein